jgi:hypothetical protein
MSDKLSLKEARQMVIDGDINLVDYRSHFKRFKGRDTTLTDDQILGVICEAEDDLEPGGWADAMEMAESPDKAA